MTDLHKMSGVDLLDKISSGELQVVPTDYIAKVRDQVSEACEELLSVGARIRPLWCDGKVVGWVRGLHISERKILNRWVTDPQDALFHILKLATSLKDDEINSLSTSEVSSLSRVVASMGEYDYSLYPYILAFSTTSVSEQLWFAKGQAVSSFEEKKVYMPGGSVMTVKYPPDHARLWSTLCAYREANKKKVEDSFHALMIVRPWVGRSADPIASDLKKASRRLQPDALEPWQSVVTPSEEIINDGWAHSGADDSVAGLQREMNSILAVDKHERVMKLVAKQQKEEAEKEKCRIDNLVGDRKVGIEATSVTFVSGEEAEGKKVVRLPVFVKDE